MGRAYLDTGGDGAGHKALPGVRATPVDCSGSHFCGWWIDLNWMLCLTELVEELEGSMLVKGVWSEEGEVHQFN